MNANWQEGQANPNSSTNLPSPKAGYGTHITGTGGSANGFDATITNQASLFVYNPTGLSWDPVTSTTGTMSANTGYLLYLRGNRDNLNMLQSSTPSSNTTLRATGALPQGNLSFIGLGSNTAFSLVTNPYASPISWTSLYASGTNNAKFENYATLWDPNVGSRGGFITVDNTGTVAGGSSNITQEIQSGEAFFVQTLASVSSPSLSLLETNKSTNNNLNVFRNGTQTEALKTFLFYNNASGRHPADGVTSLFNNGYAPAVDGNDAKQIDNWDEDVSISRDGKSLSIERRPLVDFNDTIPLTVARLKVQSYEWEFQPSNFNAPDMQAYLVDNYSNTETVISLSGTTVVPFTVTSSSATSDANRFKIVFRASGALPVTFTAVKAYQKNQGIQVEWNTQNEANMDHYEVERSADAVQFTKLGTVTASGNASNNYNWLDAAPANGSNYYRIRSLERSGRAAYSRTLKVDMGKVCISISAYPNPIVGGSFSLQMNNLAKGSYALRITNAMGQEAFRKAIEHRGGFATQTIQLDNRLTNGTYQLELEGNGTRLMLKLIK